MKTFKEFLIEAISAHALERLLERIPQNLHPEITNRINFAHKLGDKNKTKAIAVYHFPYIQHENEGQIHLETLNQLKELPGYFGNLIVAILRPWTPQKSASNDPWDLTTLFLRPSKSVADDTRQHYQSIDRNYYFQNKIYDLIKKLSKDFTPQALGVGDCINYLTFERIYNKETVVNPI